MTESTDRRVRKITQLKESTARPRDLLHSSQVLASQLMRAQTGLSTLEYSILFILLLVGSLTAWSKLGKSVQTNVDDGQKKFSNVLQDALTNSNNIAPSDGFQAGGQSPRQKGSPSSTNGRMGKSTGHKSSRTTGQSGAANPSTSSSAVVISKSPPTQSTGPYDPHSPISPVTSAGTVPIGSTSSPEQGSSSPYGQGHLVDRTGFFDRIMGQELGTTGKILVGAAGAVVGAGLAMASEAALAYGSSLGCGPGAPVCAGIATVGLLGHGVYSMVNGGWEAMKGSFGRVFSSKDATVGDALNVGMTAGGAIYGLGKVKLPKRSIVPKGAPARASPVAKAGSSLPKRSNLWNQFQQVTKGKYKSRAEAAAAYNRLRSSNPSPWPDGYIPKQRILKPGETFRMAVGKGQPNNRPGGFGTFDRIPDVSTVRNRLAVKEAWKPSIDRVVTYRVKKPLLVKEGPVGPQIDEIAGKVLPGGGHQIQLMVNPKNRMEYIEIISETTIK